MNNLQRDALYIASTYGRYPVEIVSGKGEIATDSEGKKYIDLGSGIGVNALGYSNEGWVKAVTEQAEKLSHTSNLYYTEPASLLAQKLCSLTGLKKAFFSNSGAEANETAIKVARRYGETKKGEGCNKIITLNNSFHGRTHTTLSATGQEAFHKYFQPLTAGFIHIEPDVTELENAVRENKVAGIMFEVVRGEGGVLPLDKEFVSAMVEISKREDILLICDEVQTGNGRTGKLYGYMHYGFTPDVVSTAKGLGGGLPIGATLLGEKVENIFTPGMNGSTFGGNPIACAGANYVIDNLTDSLMNSVSEKSKYIFETFTNLKGVEEVTGLGLMIGIKTARPAKEVAGEALKRGVLVLTAKDKVRLLPPLNISKENLQKATDILKQIISEEI